jgi:hypothetical protein
MCQFVSAAVAAQVPEAANALLSSSSSAETEQALPSVILQPKPDPLHPVDALGTTQARLCFAVHACVCLQE